MGGGRAWVLTGGNLVSGSWLRDDRLDSFALFDDTGNAIELTPGRTFIELPRPDYTTSF